MANGCCKRCARSSCGTRIHPDHGRFALPWRKCTLEAALLPHIAISLSPTMKTFDIDDSIFGLWPLICRNVVCGLVKKARVTLFACPLPSNHSLLLDSYHRYLQSLSPTMKTFDVDDSSFVLWPLISPKSTHW